MDQIVEEFGSTDDRGRWERDAADRLRDYLGDNPGQRVVAMAGDNARLIVVLEPKPEVAS